LKSGGLRILVADDNHDNANSCAMLLQLSGHDVRIAYSGGAALEIAAEFRPQIALIDVRMPEMNGYDVARRMRAEKGGKDILLVAVTGLGQEADKRAAESAGFDHHLAKPYDLETLKPLFARCSQK
jgi:two-component system, chemotaxis family, CheB/CheR fusion protein